MKTNLLFDFLVNKENKTITIHKEFEAGIQLVWDAWTKPEILDQWWAPLPYKNETISMNFENGGTWFYAMISPENEKHYCKANYKKIENLNSFSYKDAFCNENGEDMTEMPSMNWTTRFSENNSISKVQVILNFETVEALENIIQMGLKEGFTMAINQLEDLLTQLNN
ncbi:SRPBCC domain-containing protein [Flavobacterium amnicola]|uniref:SRPBCC domain-containing protein n=1 Tax=Flavobacterium amnicola TaxID=2506422 RepID=A0A4Q1K322_9FLAO|nr:SRPBCC domain-containing protein [Flavobacterium amnicola]RXR18932.1 SRPBCC domain-containing protein [Flavobacterium amnicola]